MSANSSVASPGAGSRCSGSVKSALLVEVVESGWWWQEAAASARARVRQVVHRTVGSRSTQSAGIVTAILIGDRAGLDEDTQRRLQEGGTFHVIAISGGNIAILAGLILLLLRAGGVAPPTAAVLTIVSLVAYWQVVGFEASVSRATLGASLFLAARAVDHRTPALNTLAVSAICLVAANPLVLSDVGFLLTFGATLGILVGVPRVVRVVDSVSWLRSRRWVRRYVVIPLVGLLAATVCAELVLLPVAASNFSRVTVAGLALNFVAIPLMTITQIAGLTAVFAYPVSAPLADLCGQVAHLSTQGITSSAHLVELVPQLARRVPPPERFISALYCAALVMLALGSSRAVRTAGGAAGAVMGAVIVLGWPTTGRTGPGCPTSALRVVFLDVDQADATLLTFPSGHSMLVDAGGSVGGRSTVGERVVAPALWRAGVARLDYLVLTHGDPDHVGGAATVLRDFAPREVWEGVPVPRSEALRELETMTRDRGGVWRQTQAGDGIRIGEAEVVVRHPPPPDWERQAVRNDDSVVLEVRHHEVAFVLPGDIGSDVEAAVASRLAGAPIVVLKAPHHGSRTSSSQPLIDALRPTLAVVSAGRHNRFGHPHDEVVQRYRQAGTQVLETGRVGAVTVCSDGRQITVATERAG